MKALSLYEECNRYQGIHCKRSLERRNEIWEQLMDCYVHCTLNHSFDMHICIVFLRRQLFPFLQKLLLLNQTKFTQGVSRQRYHVYLVFQDLVVRKKKKKPIFVKPSLHFSSLLIIKNVIFARPCDFSLSDVSTCINPIKPLAQRDHESI